MSPHHPKFPTAKLHLYALHFYYILLLHPHTGIAPITPQPPFYASILFLPFIYSYQPPIHLHQTSRNHAMLFNPPPPPQPLPPPFPLEVPDLRLQPPHLFRLLMVCTHYSCLYLTKMPQQVYMMHDFCGQQVGQFCFRRVAQYQCDHPVQQGAMEYCYGHPSHSSRHLSREVAPL